MIYVQDFTFLSLLDKWILFGGGGDEFLNSKDIKIFNLFIGYVAEMRT